MKNLLPAGSEPAVANVLGEGCAHRSGLDLSLELGDQLPVPLRFPVHRVLQPLDQLLEVRYSRFECSEPFRLWIARVAFRAIAGRSKTADLADPCDQSLPIAHRHRCPSCFC